MPPRGTALRIPPRPARGLRVQATTAAPLRRTDLHEFGAGLSRQCLAHALQRKADGFPRCSEPVLRRNQKEINSKSQNKNRTLQRWRYLRYYAARGQGVVIAEQRCRMQDRVLPHSF